MSKDTVIQNETVFNIDEVSLQLKIDKAKRDFKPQKTFKVPSNNITQDLRQAMLTFFRGLTGKFGNYVATQNALVYRSVSVVDNFSQDVICLRLMQGEYAYYLGNSSRLKVTGTKVAFGNRTRNWGETEPQRILNSMGVPMLPFDAFKEAGLKLLDTVILDQGGAETVKRQTGMTKDKKPRFQDVHFTGATLFQNETKQFLFDIDRLEIEHGIFNPFIVELSKHVSSISEAYDSLEPQTVKDAKAKGIPVLRQGEHFFIKMREYSALTPDKARRGEWMDDNETPLKQARLTVQGNRDHVCSEFNEVTGLVSGWVEHRGREHGNLDLRQGWWLPVPNTAARAFTIIGDVD